MDGWILRSLYFRIVIDRVGVGGGDERSLRLFARGLVVDGKAGRPTNLNKSVKVCTARDGNGEGAMEKR